MLPDATRLPHGVLTVPGPEREPPRREAVASMISYTCMGSCKHEVPRDKPVVSPNHDVH